MLVSRAKRMASAPSTRLRLTLLRPTKRDTHWSRPGQQRGAREPICGPRPGRHASEVKFARGLEFLPVLLFRLPYNPIHTGLLLAKHGDRQEGKMLRIL